jgi:cobyric acid synthase
VLFVVDEAFADFVPDYESLALEGLANTVVLRSFTKIYAIPGLRLGFALAVPALSERLRERIPTWSVGSLTQAVGVEVLRDRTYLEQTLLYISRERELLRENLTRFPSLSVFPGAANYLLLRVEREERSAREVADALLRRGVAVRLCGSFESLDDRYFRVAVRRREENRILHEALAGALDEALSWREPETQPGGTKEHTQPGGTKEHTQPGGTGEPTRPKGIREQTRSRGAEESGDSIETPLPGVPPHIRTSVSKPSIMLQGTSSNAGKSLLAAALCRILLQDGYAVAPFKAQNMSLNSFVTRNGGEMGRAQVVQAQACRLEPDVRMNPILLKPSSDTGSQVILLGKPIGNLSAVDYYAYKRRLVDKVRDSYDGLACDFDAIVLEGAGSPGEVNLKAHDLVNMRMAYYARSPVLIVGDIDRGGVFASFIGTMEVLAAWERSLVAGFLVNKFRGDASLLDPALEYTLRHTARPVLGVVPFLHEHGIPEEDSVSFKEDIRKGSKRSDGASGSVGSHEPNLSTEPDGLERPEPRCVRIGIVDLPHISNFTDFDALAIEPDVELSVIGNLRQLEDHRWDALILPGSKNVIADFVCLESNGLAAAIRKLALTDSVEIVGLCGGYQMLGRRIEDPHHLESALGRKDGIGLLDIKTVLSPEKTLVRTEGRHLSSGQPIVGYEIHHGKSDSRDTRPVILKADGEAIGSASSEHRVWGTYLHGVFDSDPFRRWFIDSLRRARGWEPLGGITATYDLEPAFDRIADVVRESLPMERIYRIMGLR